MSSTDVHEFLPLLYVVSTHIHAALYILRPLVSGLQVLQVVVVFWQETDADGMIFRDKVCVKRIRVFRHRFRPVLFTYNVERTYMHIWR